MPQALKTLIKHFEFTNENRAAVSLVGDIRLDPARNVVELKPNANGDFPTTGEHYVIGPLFQPKAARQWLAFQAFIEHPESLTGDGFRLHDGTDQWRWNGSSWIVDASAWNTEQEIADHIATFPVTARKLRVVVRLTTTDKTKTPSLSLVKVAWSAKINFIEDAIYRSLAPQLRTFRYLKDFAFKVPFPGGTSLSLVNPLAEAGIPLNVVGADSIFNHDLDAEHRTDLLSSYNSGTKVATLSTAIPVGNFAFAQLLVEPEVAVGSTSPDFNEVEKVPSLQIVDIESVESSPLAQDDGVVNKGTGDCLRLPAPYRINIRFSMIALAPGAVDLMRMIESIVGFMDNEPFLYSPALDQKFRLWMVDEFNVPNGQASLSDLHSSSARFIISDILDYKKPAVLEKAVQRIKFRGDMSVDSDTP